MGGGIFLAMEPASPFYPTGREEIRNEIMHSSSASTDTQREKKKRPEGGKQNATAVSSCLLAVRTGPTTPNDKSIVIYIIIYIAIGVQPCLLILFKSS